MFSGFQYLLIDAANAFGLDKETYDVRLDWARENFEVLEELEEQADEFYLYVKAVAAVRKAQRGEASGHMVGFDAICSGLQIMSAMTGCRKGAEATGLIDTGKRPDAYTECTTIMQSFLPWFQASARKKVKNAVMTHFYGSYMEPVKEFGEGSEGHNTFLKSVPILAPAAAELREYLRQSWNPETTEHRWILPDGFDVRAKVTVEKEKRIEVDELGGATFTYYYEEVEAKEDGVSNIANMIHSVDAYLVRCVERRCNYDVRVMTRAHEYILNELLKRSINSKLIPHGTVTQKFIYFLEQYNRSTVPDVVICHFLNPFTVQKLSDKHLNQLLTILEDMLCHKPFPTITVHDDFKAHANNMNSLRWHYKEVLADIADSNLIDDLMSQIFGKPLKYAKKSPDLGDYIRKSNYALT
jgi:hypothetical protein